MKAKKYGSILCVVSCFVSLSCQTTRTIQPTFSGAPRQGLKLASPILISFNDSRAGAENSEQTIRSLSDSLTRLYGNNLALQNYFEAVPPGRIGLKIDIANLEANFEARIVSIPRWRSETQTVRLALEGSWGNAVATAAVSQPVLREDVVVGGYWVGTAYLNITFVDNTRGESRQFRFPLAGEDLQSNTWGYRSGSEAAQNAWNGVATSLLRTIDAIAMQLSQATT